MYDVECMLGIVWCVYSMVCVVWCVQHGVYDKMYVVHGVLSMVRKKDRKEGSKKEHPICLQCKLEDAHAHSFWV